MVDRSGGRTASTYIEPYTEDLLNFAAGSEKSIVWNFEADVSYVTEYRKVLFRGYEMPSGTSQLLDENLLFEQEMYIMCPAADDNRVLGIPSSGPDIIYSTGQRNPPITGPKLSLLHDHSSYTVKRLP